MILDSKEWLRNNLIKLKKECEAKRDIDLHNYSERIDLINKILLEME